MYSENFQGMDVEHARTTARQMDGGTGMVRGLVGGITQMLASVTWEGEDAQRFKADWEGTFLPQLNGVTDALQTNAAVLKRRADAQEQASAT